MYEEVQRQYRGQRNGQNSGGILYVYRISTGKLEEKRELDRQGVNGLIIFIWILKQIEHV
jgi:hypothetical protein